MKAYVNPDLCIGCGLCANICPEVFEYGTESYATVIGDQVPAGAEDSAKEAKDSCPSEAIQLD